MLFDLVCCQCGLTNLGDVQVQAGGGEQRGGGGAGEERGGRGADHRARGEEVHRDQAGEVALVDGGPPHCAGAAHLITLQHVVTRCKLTNTHNYRLCWLGDRLDICFVRTLITCSLFSFYSHIIEITRPGIIEYFLIWLATTTCTLVLVSPNQHITSQHNAAEFV